MGVHQYKIKKTDGTELELEITDTGEHLEFHHLNYKAIIKVRKIEEPVSVLRKSRYKLTPPSTTYHYSLRVYKPGASEYFVAVPHMCDMFIEGVKLIENDYKNI